MLVNVPRLVTAYYTETCLILRCPSNGLRSAPQGIAVPPSKRLSTNGTSSPSVRPFACTGSRQKIDGPLFLGMDTHALSVPALASALEVLAANGVDVMIAEDDEYTPTPAISHAILTYNRGRKTGLADGIVITPSHNPPHDGGFKYNPPNGGPAETGVTGWIEAKANEFLESGLQGVKRIPFEKALRASTTHRHDYLNAYVDDLGNVIDMDAIRGAKISLGVDPLGGAGVHYWGPIAERYGLNLTVVNEAVDPTFRFMTVDWDGQIRMDPSSPYAMQRLIGLKDRFDIAFACDTDHDRHGIVTRSAGLLPPNHYLSVAIFYLFQHRPKWRKEAAVGKTVVSSQMIDRVTAKLGRKLYEVPVGFKWFVDGLLDGSLGFGGEESAGASFAPSGRHASGRRTRTASSRRCSRRRSPRGWAAIPARSTASSRASSASRSTTASRRRPLRSKRNCWRNSRRSRSRLTELAGEKIQSILTHAPGNGAPIGGLKVIAESGWFAARPSGTEDIYKIYAESFRGADHLRRILEEAQTIVSDALAACRRRQPVSRVQGKAEGRSDEQTTRASATRSTIFCPRKSRGSIPWPSWPWICAGRGTMPPTRCGGSSIPSCGSSRKIPGSSCRRSRGTDSSACWPIPAFRKNVDDLVQSQAAGGGGARVVSANIIRRRR